MRLATIACFLCGLSIFAADRAAATTPPPLPKPAVPDPVLDPLRTMSTDVANACDATTFSGLRAAMGGQAVQALAGAEARLARHERRFPLQKEKRERGEPLDPVHQGLVDDVKTWQDYMRAVNNMQFAPGNCLPDMRGAFYLPGTDTMIQIGGYVRQTESSAGDHAGLGVRVIPGDPYFLRFANRISLTGFQGEVSLNRGTWWHTVGAGFARGSERSSVSSPNGGDDIGYVPGDPNLGAGANFGNTGSSATGKVSLTEFNFNYKAMQPFNLQNGFAWGWGPNPDEEASRKAFGWTFSYGYRYLEYSGHLQRDADPNNVFVDVNHDLSTHRFTAGPAFYGERMLGGGWFLHGKADAQIGFMRSRLDTMEVTCLGCGGVNPGQSHIDDSKTSFAWSARAQAGIGYQWTPNLKLVLGAEAWVGNRHILDTRRNPTDGGTGIATWTETDYGAFARIVYASSDVRLKRDIVAVGRLANGLALYHYRYLWSDIVYVGVMAQEAAEVAPEAVVRGADGFLRVDYGKLGTRLMTWDEWRGPTLTELASVAR